MPVEIDVIFDSGQIRGQRRAGRLNPLVMAAGAILVGTVCVVTIASPLGRSGYWIGVFPDQLGGYRAGLRRLSAMVDGSQKRVWTVSWSTHWRGWLRMEAGPGAQAYVRFDPFRRTLSYRYGPTASFQEWTGVTPQILRQASSVPFPDQVLYRYCGNSESE